MDFDQVIGRFENVRRSGDGVTARCKAHDDRNNSLSITPTNDRTLVNCHAGCDPESICEAAGLTLADLFKNGHHPNGNGVVSSGLTLQQFAGAKGFDVDFLTQHGVKEENGRLIFHYLLMNGQRAARQRIRLSLDGDKRFIWNKAEGRPVPYGLWRLEEARKCGADLHLVEGESDWLTLVSHGISALGIAGADMCSTLAEAHVRGFRRVYVVRENDHGGEVFERGCTGRLSELQYQGELFVLEMATFGLKDPNALHVKLLGEPGEFERAWEALRANARPIDLELTGLEVSELSSIAREKVTWLWQARLPLGKVVVFAGDPGLGKSSISLTVAAHVSTGRAWPDRSPGYGPAGTLIFSVEDGYGDTVRPRSEALGADLGKIHVVQANRQRTADGELTRRAFNLATDIPDLERAIGRIPDTRLVVIDPFSAFLGRVDANSNAEIRGQIMAPLADFAQRHQVCVLLITHLNKGSGNPLQRLSGSIGIAGAARAIWFFARDPEDEERVLMLQAKNNLARNPGGLAYCLVNHPELEVATIAWEPEPVMTTADDILAAQAEQRASGGKLEAACGLLHALCPIETTELEKEAKSRGISIGSVWRARERLHVVSKREGGFGREGKWILKLPA